MRWQVHPVRPGIETTKQKVVKSDWIERSHRIYSSRFLAIYHEATCFALAVFIGTSFPPPSLKMGINPASMRFRRGHDTFSSRLVGENMVSQLLFFQSVKEIHPELLDLFSAHGIYVLVVIHRMSTLINTRAFAQSLFKKGLNSNVFS